MQTPLVLVSNKVKSFQANGRAQVDDLAPRQDYLEMGRRLGGRLAGYDLFDGEWYTWTRRLEKRLKLDLVESVWAANQWTNHNLILSASEKIAIPLAALLKLSGRRIPHIVIGHKLSSGGKRQLLNLWPLHREFSRLICICQTQVDYALTQLQLPASRVHFVHNTVDHRFFRPIKVETEPYILAVGQEQRDYMTLLRALAGTGLKLIVVASSPWSTSQIEIDKVGEVQVLSHIPYQELRSLYARARLVVVPLYEVNYAAGVSVLLEAMAMAKPVVISRTAGISDYVVPDETGVYVAPGDPDEVRQRILDLWEQPTQLERLGNNARQLVEEKINMDLYVEQVAQIVNEVLATAGSGVN